MPFRSLLMPPHTPRFQLMLVITLDDYAIFTISYYAAMLRYAICLMPPRFDAATMITPYAAAAAAA